MENEFQFDSVLSEFYGLADSPEQLFNKERYIDEEFIAEGAIKRVSKVTDTHCERAVALARIKEDVFDLQQTVDFIREVQVTSRFEHPNIVRIYDIGITEGVPWFTMELTSGTTLTEVIRADQLQANQKLDIFLDLCSAIQYAHERDVLHLDIKPDNISFGFGGQILVGDWGIASSLVVRDNDDISGSDTVYGHMKGTPGFMAPEQVKGDYAPVPQTDIYALGALFYFLLMGTTPTIGDTSHAILSSTVNGRLKNFDHPNIPQRLIPILKKCLEPLPPHRYTSVQELQSEIEKFRDGFATQAESTSLSALTKLFLKRHKKSCAAATLILAAVISSFFFYVREIQHRESIAENERSKALMLLKQVQESEEKFKEQTYILKEQTHEYAEDLVERSRSQLSLGNVHRAYASIQTAHKLAPDDEKIMARYGYLSFMVQRFDQANTYLDKHDQRQKRVLLRQLAAQQASPNETPLNIPELFGILCSKVRHPDATYFFLNDAKRSPKGQHAKLVKILLERENKMSNMKFSWDQKEQILDLSGNGDFKTLLVKKMPFAPAYNITAGLPAKKIILDDTPRNKQNAQSYIPRSKCLILLKTVK